MVTGTGLCGSKGIIWALLWFIWLAVLEYLLSLTRTIYKVEKKLLNTKTYNELNANPIWWGSTMRWRSWRYPQKYTQERNTFKLL